MTEEIIIDGVNVAECGYYDAKNDKGSWCDLTCTQEHAPFFRCESMPYCYYKQLQRLKQENETIREHCKQVDETNKILYKEKCDLIQENEELKKFFDSAAKKNTRLENKMKEYHERYDELYWTTDQLVKDKTRLKQALEEIREIADKCKECLNEDDDCGCDYLRIVRKINEVLK